MEMSRPFGAGVGRGGIPRARGEDAAARGNIQTALWAEEDEQRRV